MAVTIKQQPQTSTNVSFSLLRILSRLASKAARIRQQTVRSLLQTVLTHLNQNPPLYDSAIDVFNQENLTSHDLNNFELTQGLDEHSTKLLLLFATWNQATRDDFKAKAVTSAGLYQFLQQHCDDQIICQTLMQHPATRRSLTLWYDYRDIINLLAEHNQIVALTALLSDPEVEKLNSVTSGVGVEQINASATAYRYQQIVNSYPPAMNLFSCIPDVVRPKLRVPADPAVAPQIKPLANS